jgi:hypothetical protein
MFFQKNVVFSPIQVYIISMNNFKRIIAFLALFSGLAVFSYGETFYSFSLGLIRKYDFFPEEDFDRTLTGTNTNFAFLYAPEASPWGFFTQTSIFVPTTIYERQGEIATLLGGSNNAWNLRICAAPACTLRPGQKIRIPISLGPVFFLSGEDWDGYTYEQYSDERKYYEAWGMGLAFDASLIVLFDSWSWFSGGSSNLFFLWNGISVGCDFLRLEKGEMQSTFREPGGARLKIVPYLAPSVSIFLGIGIRFD